MFGLFELIHHDLLPMVSYVPVFMTNTMSDSKCSSNISYSPEPLPHSSSPGIPGTAPSSSNSSIYRYSRRCSNTSTDPTTPRSMSSHWCCASCVSTSWISITCQPIVQLEVEKEEVAVPGLGLDVRLGSIVGL